MKIKNQLVSWYIRKILGPNVVRYDNPGFVVTILDTPYGHTCQRDIFLPESLISNIEIKVVEKFGDKGKEILYSIGKQFGYNFSKLFNVPKITKNNKDGVEKFIQYAIMFISATWAKKFDYSLNFDKKILNVNFSEYVVCRKNGIGEIFTSGGPAGVWSLVFNDYSIEGVQTECQGRGDRRCKVICAPRKYFEDNNIEYYKINQLLKIEYSQRYVEYNKIQRTSFSKVSAKELIMKGVFKYKDSMILYKNERYFPTGAEFIYLLEYVLGQIEGGLDLLFSVAFEFGKKIAEDYGGSDFKFITDYMSALGWGDVARPNAENLSIGANFFPWTELADKIDFALFRGILSGILTVFLNKKIIFDKIKKSTINSLSIIAYR